MSFLAGLLSGTQTALQRRIDQTNQDRLEHAASRQIATQYAREDLRNAVISDQWQQMFDQRGSQFDATLAQRQTESEAMLAQREAEVDAANTRAANALANAIKLTEMREKGLTTRHTATTNLQRELEGGRNTRFMGQLAFDREIANLLESGRNTRHGESLTLQDTLARLQERGINTRHAAALAQGDQHFYGTLGMRQDELAQRVSEAEAMNWYREQQNALGWAEHEARKLGGYYNRGGTGRPDGLSTQAYESIKNMADVFARTQNNSGAIKFWFDPKKSVLQQSRDLEGMGAAIMNQLMTSTANDPVEAMKGLPVFWSHMITAGKEGEYGEELQRDLLSGITPGNEYQRFDAMYNAVMRGALKSIGQEIPQADSGITELQNDQPQSLTKALNDWGLTRHASTHPTHAVSPLVSGLLLRDALKGTEIYKGIQNWGRSEENRIQ